VIGMAAIRAVAGRGAGPAPAGPERVSTAVVCLAHTLAFHDLPADADALVHEHAIDKDEVDDALLLRMARERGLKGRVARIGWRSLVRLGEALPAVARLTNGRCVLVVRVVEPDEPGPDAKLAVFDPLATGGGLLTLDRETFEASWGGTVILLRPEAIRDADGDEHQPFGLRWFLPEIVAQRSLLRDVALAAIVLQVLGLAGPIFFQLVVDKVLVHGSVTTLAVLVVGVALAAVFEGLFSYLRELLLLFATNRIDIRLAKQTFAKLMSLPLPFFEQNPVGRVVQGESKLPLAMSSSIWLAWIEAALRLGIESGRPMYNQNRFPCHDQTKRSRSLKILTLHSLKRYRSFIPLFV
jgi:ATP-binding cassette subfamily B protein